MKILAIEKETGGKTSADFAPYLRDEALKVLELYEKGFIREIYFGKDDHNAVIILECGSLTEAQQYLNELPLVKNGLLTFSLTELIPYDGFSRLKK